jgi:hypothetical protein
MQKMAVLRLWLPGSGSSATKDAFWSSYWQLDRLSRSRDATQSHENVINEFGPLLSEKLSNLRDGWNVEVRVRAIRYGSIELLLALFGGEELFTEMFWTALEFYAPEAFNQAAAGDVPLQAGVTHERGAEHGGGGHGGNRVVAMANAPVILVILGVVVTVGLLIWKIESLEHENIELRHDYTHIVGRVTQQNGTLIGNLMARLGVVATPENGDHKYDEKAVAPAQPTAATPVPATPPAPKANQRNEKKPEN